MIIDEYVPITSGDPNTAERKLRRFLDFVNFFAKSPYLNQAALLRQACEEFGYDAGKLMKEPDVKTEP